jgi:hypothetical protein
VHLLICFNESSSLVGVVLVGGHRRVVGGTHGHMSDHVIMHISFAICGICSTVGVVMASAADSDSDPAGSVLRTMALAKPG